MGKAPLENILDGSPPTFSVTPNAAVQPQIRAQREFVGWNCLLERKPAPALCDEISQQRVVASADIQYILVRNVLEGLE